MRSRILTIALAASGGLAVLLVFILLRGFPFLIQALSAFGTVSAAVFTAFAAFAAMRAATESGAAARLAREALGRTLKPTIYAWISEDPTEPSKAIGYITVSSDRGAAGIIVAWHMRGGRTESKDIGTLEPEPTGANPHLPYTMPIGAWLGTAADAAEKVVVEYSDMSKTLRWRYIKRFMTEAEWTRAGYSREHYDTRKSESIITDEPSP